MDNINSVPEIEAAITGFERDFDGPIHMLSLFKFKPRPEAAEGYKHVIPCTLHLAQGAAQGRSPGVRYRLAGVET